MGKIGRIDGLDRSGGEEVGRARKWRRWWDWVEMDPEVGDAGGRDWTGRIPRKQGLVWLYIVSWSISRLMEALRSKSDG